MPKLKRFELLELVNKKKHENDERGAQLLKHKQNHLPFRLRLQLLNHSPPMRRTSF